MKKTLSFLTITILIVLGVFFICTNYLNVNFENLLRTEPVELSIYAPTSLRNAMDKIKESYEADHNSVKLSLTYKSSYEITQEILNGKKPDLAVVASQRDLEELNEKALIVPDTQEILAKNTMVLIAPVDSSIDSIEDLSSDNVEKIAVGDPDSTSIGHYSTSVLKNMGLYNNIQWKLRELKNVQTIVEQVTNETVQAGIVFKTDAMNNEKIKVVAEFPTTLYTPINYTMFETATEENEEYDNVKELEEYLLSEPTQKIFTDNGFTAVSNASKTTNNGEN